MSSKIKTVGKVQRRSKMTQDTVETFEQAMETVSDSIANFKRFVMALNKFLELHKLGSVVLKKRGGLPELDGFTHRYDITMFTLRDPLRNDILYVDLYTDGRATGENFKVDNSVLSRAGGCTWDEAIEETLETIGVLQHTALSREKIGKIIELLG
ncbi:MAG: hypothetical protein NTV02_02850 [Candidatus Zambryskibacteria bacterium]|nr:hypothetical protein [Candidatus Zambryskibacteria bacterium]